MSTIARCSCGNATCSCIIKPVPDGGVTVVGNGSSARPYLLGLASGGNPLDNFVADTTPSLTLQTLGAGTPSDKMHLSGIATQALTELRDVSDPVLQVGDVPVWKGDHWEFEAQTGGSGGGGAGTLTPDVLHRVAAATLQTTLASTANPVVYLAVTIPNPVNGRRYRAYSSVGINPSVDGQYCRLQFGFGTGVDATNQTHFGGGYTDHRIAGRIAWWAGMAEFVYTGVTGAAGFQVLMSLYPETAKAVVPYGQVDRPGVLIVDEMITTGGTAAITQTPVPTVHGAWQQNTAQSLTTAVVTTIAYDTVVTAPVGGLTMTAGVIKVPVAGTYQVNAAVCFNTNATGSRYLYIYKNGGYLVRVAIDQVETAPTGTVSKLVDCAANDTIEIKAYQNSGAALTLLNTNQSNVADIALVDVPVGTGVAGIATSGSIMGDGSAGNTIRPGYAIAIPNAIDLNTYTLPGEYGQRLSSQATAGSNYPPIPTAGLLEVFSNGSNMVWQRYTNYPSGSNVPEGGLVYERGSYNGVWTAWQVLGGEPALPVPTDTYIGTDQTITTTTGGTETPTAVRNTMVNPHSSKRLLVRVDVQARGICTGGGSLAYFGIKNVSGGSNAVPGFEFAADATFVQTNMIGYAYSWIPANGTGVYGMYCSKGNTGFALVIRYCHTSIIPIRYE